MPAPSRPRLRAALPGTILAFGFLAVTLLLLRATAGMEPGGHLVEASIGEVHRASPLAMLTSEAEGDVVALAFAGLMRLGPDGTPEPHLAESWEVTPDGRTYTFHLRPGLTWHDGSPLTADDAAFTVTRIQSPDFTGPPVLATAWSGVQSFVEDRRTVLFHLPEPSADFLARATVGLVPRHLAGEMAPGHSLDAAPFERRPVGAGPYRVERIADDRVLLRRFDSYALGRPVIGRIELRLASNAETQARMLQRGDVDAALLAEAVPDDELRSGAHRIVPLTRHSYVALYLNHTRPPLQDDATRIALATAIDRATILATTGLHGIPGAGPLVPGSWAATPATVTTSNLAALWAAAGWTLDGGVRQRDGQALLVEVLTNDDPARRAVAEVVASQWRAQGVQVRVVVLPPEQVIQERLRPGAFQAAVFGWELGTDPDPYPAWHSSQIGAGGGNVTSFRDPEVDALLESARGTLDTNERRELYALFADRFVARAASVVLFSPQRLYVVPQHLDGAPEVLLVTPGSRFHDIHRWTLR